MTDIIDKSFDYWYNYIKQKNEKDKKREKLKIIFSF